VIPRELLAKIDAVQRGRFFKIVASIVLVLLVVTAGVSYVVMVNKPADPSSFPIPEADPAASPDEKNAIDATRRIVSAVMAGAQDTTSVLVGLAVGLALSLAIVWLGLGLTYFALMVAGLTPALLLWWGGYPSLAWLLGGVVALTASFSVFMRSARVVLGGPFRVLAIARNVLDEATRLNISLVFIVLLIVGLAILPLTIESTEQLRYRVQTFLSFSMGGSFWTIATLVVLFSVATVAFEQRDRVIWQTMTKPVAAWQYVLGKWLGVVSLAAILLAVSGSGIFLFTEHLRSQPAAGERPDQAYSTESGNLSKDRRILESQILSARKTRYPEGLAFDKAALAKTIELVAASEIDLKSEMLDAGQRAMFEGSREARYAAIEKELKLAYQQQYRSIEPGQRKIYRFTGLEAARDSDQLLILRYKVDTGNNAPNELYKVTFEFLGGDIAVKDVVLGQFQILELLPSAIDAEGGITMGIINGDPIRGVLNARTISYPPDGLEISYAVSSFAANFVRVLIVLWVKLAFLAMLGVAAATFLSFPVACLVAFGTFLAAESAPFLRASLESFSTTSDDGKEIYYIRTVMAYISSGVTWLFSTYGDLHPTRRAVEGILMSWREVGTGLIILTAWTAALYAAAVGIFRKRELATYSGH
jgi:ABC-type transport system involved in multi-copper enzyme maturation permease subunit